MKFLLIEFCGIIIRGISRETSDFNEGNSSISDLGRFIHSFKLFHLRVAMYVSKE